MSQLIYSLIESPMHPDATVLYQRLGLQELAFVSMRKALAALKTMPPDIVVADFLYGYGNNYAGANVSNLDVFLRSLQRYAPGARIIVLVDKAEREHVDKLAGLFRLHAVLQYPVDAAELEQALVT